MTQHLRQIILFIFSIFALAHCGSDVSGGVLGGGSGGGQSLESQLKGARLEIDANPRTLGIGDRSLVRVHIREVDVDGVIVKVRYPENVRYAPDTSILRVGNDSVDVGPFTGPSKSGEKVYIVYYFSRDSFDNNGAGLLEFELRSVSAVTSADVEVDSDRHDPDRNLSDEFRIKNPLFGVEDSIRLRVTDP